MSWVLWAVMLLIQNATFTWVSRARNSKSLGYHAVAATFSNGIWFLNLAVAVDKLRGVEGWAYAGVALFYTVFTVIGSVGAHYVLMRHVERKVGA